MTCRSSLLNYWHGPAHITADGGQSGRRPQRRGCPLGQRHLATRRPCAVGVLSEAGPLGCGSQTRHDVISWRHVSSVMYTTPPCSKRHRFCPLRPGRAGVFRPCFTAACSSERLTPRWARLSRPCECDTMLTASVGVSETSLSVSVSISEYVWPGGGALNGERSVHPRRPLPPASRAMAEQSPFAGDSTDASFRSVALTPVAWDAAAAADGAERRYSASPAARSMTKVRPARAARVRERAHAPDGHARRSAERDGRAARRSRAPLSRRRATATRRRRRTRSTCCSKRSRCARGVAARGCVCPRTRSPQLTRAPPPRHCAPPRRSATPSSWK